MSSKSSSDHDDEEARKLENRMSYAAEHEEELHEAEEVGETVVMQQARKDSASSRATSVSVASSHREAVVPVQVQIPVRQSVVEKRDLKVILMLITIFSD